MDNANKVACFKEAFGTLGEEAKIIHQYKYLRSCLKNFENLVRNEVISLEDNVKLQIEECTRHIPLITDFYDKLIEGDRLEEDEAKREVYHQALKMIEGFEEPGYLLARAFGVTNLALTYRFDDNKLFYRDGGTHRCTRLRGSLFRKSVP